MAARTGAPVLQHPAIKEGDTWSAGGASLESMYTPGHASDHVAFLLREERALFAGDLVMAGSSIMIAPPDGDVVVYLDSVARVRALGLRRIYPGHGEVIDAPDDVLDEAVRHRRKREAQIIERCSAALPGSQTWFSASMWTCPPKNIPWPRAQCTRNC